MSNALPPVRPCECGVADCWAQDGQPTAAWAGPCWGEIEVIDEDYTEDDWWWIHGCEGHRDRFGKYLPPPATNCPACAFEAGAAVAFGIIDMFEAIRANAPRIVERSYWVSEIDGEQLYNCHCPGCGAYMKARAAGKDEGTDNEWCGACRY